MPFLHSVFYLILYISALVANKRVHKLGYIYLLTYLLTYNQILVFGTALIVCKTRNGVYKTVRRPSVRQSVCLGLGPQQQTRRCSGRERSIDCCTAARRRRMNADSATLSAYVGGWTQTCK